LRPRRPHLAAFVVVLTVATVLGAAPAPALAGFRFTGVTDQNQPLDMTLSGSGRSVKLRIGYQVSCTSGLTFPDSETVNAPAHPTRNRRHRLTAVKFSAEGTGSVQASTADGQALAGTIDIVVAGNIRLTSGHAIGRVESTIALSNGDKCTTGTSPIRWAAAIAPPARANAPR